MDIFIGLFIIAVCCIVIWRASDGFEIASQYIGRNLSDGVRGATINAIGSSMPELFTTLFFFFYYSVYHTNVSEANNGFAGGIGTTAGSAIFNGMIIPAIVIFAVIGYGLAKNVKVGKKIILRDGLALITAELILIFLISDSTLYWWHGLILMATYGVYVTFMLRTMTEKEEEDEEEYYQNDHSSNRLLNILTINLAPLFIKDKINKANAWPLLITSMLIIGLACFFLVYSCELTAAALGIKTYFVAVILASAATSVPDTILSYKDAINGDYDDAVANALGSNIFDVCFALGLPLFIFTMIYGPLQMSPDTIENVSELRVILLALTVVAFFIYYFGEALNKAKAYLFLVIYVVFVSYIYGRAYQQEWAVNVGQFLRELLL